MSYAASLCNNALVYLITAGQRYSELYDQLADLFEKVSLARYESMASGKTRLDKIIMSLRGPECRRVEDPAMEVSNATHGTIRIGLCRLTYPLGVTCS